MNRLPLPTLLITAALLLVSGCAHQKSTPVKDSSPGAEIPSSVDISYFLGHTRRITLDSKDGQVVGRNFMDRQVLKETRVDQGRFLAFYRKAGEFMQRMNRTPAGDIPGCRTPFEITIKSDRETRTYKGCRSSDERGLSRLVKDGEFLLYSGK